MCGYKFFLFLILPTIIASKRGFLDRVDPTTNRMTSTIQHTSFMRCPSKCKCDASRKEVNCSYKSLNSLPRGIPTFTKRLILSGNKLKKLSRKRILSLRHLEVLELHGNYINAVNGRIFRHLRKLKKLNLSFNNLDNLSAQSFKQLKNLRILNLRGNNLGKLPIDVFEGLDHIVEIDISANSLQTLEFDMFEELTTLKTLFLSNNQWHCDCSLKEADLGLRERGVTTGFIICDSPNLYTGQQLGGLSVNSFCGTKAESLAYIVLGTISGIICILFLIFMCRRRIAPNIDLSEARNTINGKSKNGSAEDVLSRSSIIYDSENDGSVSSREKTVDLLRTSRDLNTDVLSLTDDVTAPHHAPALSTFRPGVSSCPDLVNCSDNIKKFNDD